MDLRKATSRTLPQHWTRHASGETITIQGPSGDGWIRLTPHERDSVLVEVSSPALQDRRLASPIDAVEYAFGHLASMARVPTMTIEVAEALLRHGNIKPIRSSARHHPDNTISMEGSRARGGRVWARMGRTQDGAHIVVEGKGSLPAEVPIPGTTPVRRNHHLQPGTSVYHPQYGAGTVQSTVGYDDYQVAFPSGVRLVPGHSLSRANVGEIGMGGLGTGGFLGSGTAEAMRGSWREGRIGEGYAIAPGVDSYAREQDAKAIEKLRRKFFLDVEGDLAGQVARKLDHSIGAAADLCALNPPVCTGNLGIPRSSMPQFTTSSAAAFVRALRDKGVRVDGEPGLTSKFSIPVGELKATQREISAVKALSMARAFQNGTFPGISDNVLVVKDPKEGYYILDGHHRWAALLLDNPANQVKAIVIHAPIREVLAKALAFPGVGRASLTDGVRVNPMDRVERALRDRVRRAFKRAYMDADSPADSNDLSDLENLWKQGEIDSSTMLYILQHGEPPPAVLRRNCGCNR